MRPERDSVPPLAADFAQRVLRQARYQRRRNATVRVALALGASLAVLTLFVRPAHRPLPKSSESGALASSELLVEGEASDLLDSDDEDPGSYFFPDSQSEPQALADSQSVTDDSPSDLSTGLEGTEE
jgi:hypothetical protein